MDAQLKAAIKTLKDMPYNPEYSGALHIIRIRLNEYESALSSIKSGVYHLPPEHSYGDYQKKRINNLKEAQDFAASILRGN